MAVPTGHIDTAIANYQILLKTAPNNPMYRVGLGVAYLGKKEFENALQQFDASIAHKPTAPAHYGKALVYREQGKLDAAIEQMRDASTLAPGNRLYAMLLQQLSAARQGAKAQ